MIRISAYTTDAKANEGVNEDSFAIRTARVKFFGNDECEMKFSTSDLPLLVSVADGVGGYPYGKETSEKVNRMLLSEPFEKDLKDMVETINNNICEKEEHGYTTISALKITGKSRGSIVSVGDSRVYRGRGTEWTCLTRDDSMREFFGVFYSKEEARKRSYLTACIGMNRQEICQRDIFLKEGDWYLLCTDGVYDSIFEWNLNKFTSPVTEPGECMLEFLKRLCSLGGFIKDNATIVVIEILPDEGGNSDHDIDEWEF